MLLSLALKDTISDFIISWISVNYSIVSVLKAMDSCICPIYSDRPFGR